MDTPNTCECLYYLGSTLTLLPTCPFRLVDPNFSSQKTRNFLHVNQFICYDVVFALIFFHLLAWNLNLEKNLYLFKQILFHSSESSFTCTGLDGIGLAWRLMMRNRGPCNITRVFTIFIAHAQFAIINLFVCKICWQLHMKCVLQSPLFLFFAQNANQSIFRVFKPVQVLLPGIARILCSFFI